jgi:hypothetical protein
MDIIAVQEMLLTVKHMPTIIQPRISREQSVELRAGRTTSPLSIHVLALGVQEEILPFFPYSHITSCLN